MLTSGNSPTSTWDRNREKVLTAAERTLNRTESIAGDIEDLRDRMDSSNFEDCKLLQRHFDNLKTEVKRLQKGEFGPDRDLRYIWPDRLEWYQNQDDWNARSNRAIKTNRLVKMLQRIRDLIAVGWGFRKR